MFKRSNNCIHFTCWQINAQNSPSEASTACEPRTKDIVNTFPKEETPKEHAQAGIGFGIK